MKVLAPLLLLALTGCTALPGTGAPALTVRAASTPLTGLVVDLRGTPVVGATVRSDLAEATTDTEGRFRLEAPDSPSWIGVRAPGHLPRTEVAQPGRPLLSRLTPQDGTTVSLRFGGDVMAGRRFYDRNQDGRAGDGLLRRGDGLTEHVALLEDVRPLLQEPDLAIVNLESPLGADPAFDPSAARPQQFHQSKGIAFASATVLAEAMAQSGVDVVDLGNNHLFDRLEAGIGSTVTALDDAGLAHFGAGGDLEAAWQPARVAVRGQPFAFLGCTTITGEDDPTPYIATEDRAGAAPCDPERLTREVQAQRATGATVVVAIHGGVEYQREQSPRVRALSATARTAGARFVVNHHPHVVGGVAVRDGGLEADSLGNLLFDQQVWPTFPSYLLSVDVSAGRLVRARTEPLVLQDFTPRGVTGALGDAVDRFAAGLRPGAGTSGPGGAEIVPGGPVSTRSATAELAPQEVRRLSPGWSVSGTSSSALQIGQELLWTGGFEDDDTGIDAGAHLWDLSGGALTLAQDARRSGRQGVRLTTSAAANAATLLTTDHRVLLPEADGSMTFQGAIRGARAAQVRAELHWYADTKGPSSSVLGRPVPVTSDWKSFRVEAVPPPGTIAVQVFLRLLPTEGQETLAVAVDDLQLVQWAPQGTTATPLHGAVRGLGRPLAQDFGTRLPAGGEQLREWVSGSPLLPGDQP